MIKYYIQLIHKFFMKNVGETLSVKANAFRKALVQNQGAANKIKRFGLTSIGAILLSTYVLTSRNSGKINYVENDYHKNTYVGDIVETSNTTDQESNKDESLREKYNFINNVVNRCASAVFYLEIRDPYKMDMETGEPVITSNGSGFLISEEGWALTNAHVVLNKPQSTITAIMRDGKRFKARVEDVDINVDLALLKLEALEKLPCLQFGTPGDTSVGEWVVALGSPLSLSNSVTVGIISSVNRPAEELGLKNYSMTYIQTDASITFGNSGGPLVNLDGHVIGINNLRLTSGISFAIPVEYVKKFLENSKYRIKTGRSTGPMGKILYGMTTISITPEVLSDLLRENNSIPEDVAQGLLVWKVIKGSPAALSGLEVGDIITHINGIPVKEASDLYTSAGTGGRTSINLIHNGKKKTVHMDADGLDP